MEVKVQLKITAEELFEELVQSIIADVKTSTGDIVSKEKICKGFSYNKNLTNQMGNKALAKIKIVELHSPTKYIAAVEHLKGINTIEYTLINNLKGVEINYKETFSTNSRLLNWNYLLTSFVFSASSKKRMKKKLILLGEKVLSEKNNMIDKEGIRCQN